MIRSLFIIFSFSIICISCEQSDPDSIAKKRTIKDSGDFVFSGYGWKIKSSTTPVGPGPNYFSKTNTWIDSNGFLHLIVSNNNGRWESAEVICTENTGYGTYIFTIGNDISKMNENLVLGLFTWDDNTFYSDGNSEVDIEFSKWFKKSDSLLLTCSVQPVVFDNSIPYSERTNKPSMIVSKLSYPSTHGFKWTSNDIQWYSYSGKSYPGIEEIANWRFDKTNPSRVKLEGGKSSNPIVIPQPGNSTNARMNLWLLNGKIPSDGKNFEVIIEKFQFIPA